MHQLNTSNPDYISWQYNDLSFALLGGIRHDYLDRLRVTIKMDFKQVVIRHNLDLYNDSQVEKLIRKCAERFALGTMYLNTALGELITHLETYRLQELENRNTVQETKKTMTAEERQQAESFLSTPGLLNRTSVAISQSGLVGEKDNALCMYLIYTSRKRLHPLHIISLASSGSGKSYLQEKVSELIPMEDKVEITTLSDNAFYYFGQQELKHKLILIEDLDGAENSLYPLRELQSKKKINKTVAHKDAKGNTRTVHLTVEGPVSVSGCTTKENIYEDNANRSFLIYLDESKEQDERIMAYQRRLSAGTADIESENRIKNLMQNCQRILEAVSVRNPFAEYLALPSQVFKARRTNAHYLQFIEAITYYHQFQREKLTDTATGEVYIETTVEDIQEANTLMKEMLLRKSDMLNGACRNYFENLKDYLERSQEKVFTSKDISIALRTPLSTIKRYHLQLLNNGNIKVQPESKHEKTYRYEVINAADYTELQQEITAVLQAAIMQVSAHRLIPAQLPNEPTKPNPSKRNTASAHELTGGSKRVQKNKEAEIAKEGHNEAPES